MTGISVVLLYQIKQIQDKLYTGGHDSDVYAYYSGVLHAEALQTNFSRLKCKLLAKKWIRQV